MLFADYFTQYNSKGFFMRIAIIGAGAIGRLFAFRLHDCLNDLAHIVLFTNTLAQKFVLSRTGLTHINLQNQKRCLPIRVACIKDTKLAIYDVIFVAVKQHHLSDIKYFISKISKPRTAIILLQNGLPSKQTYPVYFTYAAVVRDGALAKDDNIVLSKGEGITDIGLLQDRHIVKTPLSIQLILERLPRLRYTDDIHRVATEKFILVSVLLPLTACYGISNGHVMTYPYYQEAKLLLKETLKVFYNLGIYWSFTDAWRALEDLCQKTYDNYSSMLQDIVNKRMTEINFITVTLLEMSHDQKIILQHHKRILGRIRLREKIFSTVF